MATDQQAAQPADCRDLVVWGTTTQGKSFRPGDWAERLAGLTSAFGADRKLAYSPLVCPVCVRGAQGLVVAHTLSEIAPRFYQFLVNFARDNELTLAYAEGAIDDPQKLVPPGMGASATDEPREPV